MKTLLITVALLVSLASSAQATSIAFSEAVLDWRGFGYTVSEGLTVSRIDWSSSYAGGLAFSSQSPTGFAGATAYAVDGLLTSAAMAGTTGSDSGMNQGISWAFLGESFYLYGEGRGTLTITVPYTLTLDLRQLAAPVEPWRSDRLFASAEAFLSVGRPGYNPADISAWERLSWSGLEPIPNDTLTRTGFMTASGTFDNPWYGPLAGVYANVITNASAQVVPEPSSLWLTGLAIVGLVGLGAWRQRSAV